MMTEAFKELFIVKEHIVKLQLSITAMQTGGSMGSDDADKISHHIETMRLAANVIEEELSQYVFHG